MNDPQFLRGASPSALCKAHGTTLAVVSRESGVSVQTLANWYKNPKKQRLFELLVLGVVKDSKN